MRCSHCDAVARQKSFAVQLPPAHLQECRYSAHSRTATTQSKLPTALEYLATYPFSDYAANDVKGDYFNSDIRFNLDLSALLGPQSPIIGGGR